jgi:adenosine deaminase
VPDLKNHPFGFYHAFGVRVTLNTDSRLFADTTVTDELMLAGRTFDLCEMDLTTIVINGFKSAFLPFEEKARLLIDVLPRLGRKPPKFQASRLGRDAAQRYAGRTVGP